MSGISGGIGGGYSAYTPVQTNNSQQQSSQQISTPPPLNTITPPSPTFGLETESLIARTQGGTPTTTPVTSVTVTVTADLRDSLTNPTFNSRSQSLENLGNGISQLESVSAPITITPDSGPISMPIIPLSMDEHRQIKNEFNQMVSESNSSLGGGNIVHETMHSFGLGHTQSRTDYSTYFSDSSDNQVSSTPEFVHPDNNQENKPIQLPSSSSSLLDTLDQQKPPKLDKTPKPPMGT